jgi:hypothetical protein
MPRTSSLILKQGFYEGTGGFIGMKYAVFQVAEISQLMIYDSSRNP